MIKRLEFKNRVCYVRHGFNTIWYEIYSIKESCRSRVVLKSCLSCVEFVSEPCPSHTSYHTVSYHAALWHAKFGSLKEVTCEGEPSIIWSPFKQNLPRNGASCQPFTLPRVISMANLTAFRPQTLTPLRFSFLPPHIPSHFFAFSSIPRRLSLLCPSLPTPSTSDFSPLLSDCLERGEESEENDFLVVNFYKFVAIEAPEEEVSKQLGFLQVRHFLFQFKLAFCLCIWKLYFSSDA